LTAVMRGHRVLRWSARGNEIQRCPRAGERDVARRLIQSLAGLRGCPVNNRTRHIALGRIRPNSFPNISCVMKFRSRILKMITTRLVSVTVSKLPEAKSNNGGLRQITNCHRIPQVRRVNRRGNSDAPPEHIWLRCLLLRFSIQMDQQSSPR
jgi:hypothetical protein